MEDKDLKKLWKSYDQELQDNLQVNFSAIKKENIRKSKIELNKLMLRRGAEAILFFLFAGFFDGHLNARAIFLNRGRTCKKNPNDRKQT